MPIELHNADLSACEAVIERGLQSFIEVGQAWQRIRLGHVLQLPSGALHLTSAGRGLVRTAGVEFATCSKCGEQFQRDAFTHANRGQCWWCSPESHSDEVGRAAE